MHIALVEPSRTIRRIVSGTIEPWGHEVTSFTNAPDTLTFLQTGKDVRALITSAELQSGSGIELVSNARALAGSRRPLYIILMSSSSERSKMVEALDNGADDFISKPPAREELHARLRAADRITSMQAELIALAKTDPLTGLPNRRALFEFAEAKIERANAGRPLSALVLDLDQFKMINDRHGHDAGDLVLRRVSEEMRSVACSVGRLGGEEFAVLVEARLADAIEVAERLREDVSGLHIKGRSAPIKVTCSIGVAEWDPGDSIDSLLRRADVALYEAKRSGRNRVVAADTLPVSEKHDKWQGVARAGSRQDSRP
jgi:diguanylate cyclase (GGDEF)-like protein